MEVKTTKEGSKLLAEISGRIDTQTAPELQEELDRNLGGVRDLVLDFSAVNYISSAGLRTVVTAQKWMDMRGGTLKITHVSADIMNIFKVTGFDTFLEIE